MSHSDDFRINNGTGEITLSSNLDHITADTVVTLTVVATDHGVPQLTSNGKPPFTLFSFLFPHKHNPCTHLNSKLIPLLSSQSEFREKNHVTFQQW